MSRHAGVMMPLFSAASSRSWGLGELPDLVPLASWLVSSGFDRLMLLPLGVMPDPDTSPYSAISAMAIDPIYIAPEDVPEFARAGGTESLSEDGRAAIASAQSARTVRYGAIRRAKHEALAMAFDRFLAEEWSQLTARASDLAGYIARERWWLDDFALYVAVARALNQPAWTDWPAPLRDRESQALDEARRSLWREVLREQYLQWIAETQWQRAREGVRALGVTLMGDLPFMVSGAGPDVWARPGEYWLDVSLGVPPDAFSATGQDWAMPTYRWDRIAETGYAWIRQRARRMASLYDGYRVDHLVGLYRTYGKPMAGEPSFTPPEEPAQVAQGETILRVLVDSGAEILAEDLGLVPDFVRASLARVGVPGCKVLRWERGWHTPGHPFIEPARYPASSAAMTGTHDTETLAAWWTGASSGDRQASVALLRAAGLGEFDPAGVWSPSLHDAILALVYRSGSDNLYLPIQDVFGWFDRINVPGTIGDHNWTWRLPWPVDRLGEIDDAVRCATARRRMSAQGQRGPGPWRVRVYDAW